MDPLTLTMIGLTLLCLCILICMLFVRPWLKRHSEIKIQQQLALYDPEARRRISVRLMVQNRYSDERLVGQLQAEAIRWINEQLVDSASKYVREIYTNIFGVMTDETLRDWTLLVILSQLFSKSTHLAFLELVKLSGLTADTFPLFVQAIYRHLKLPYGEFHPGMKGACLRLTIQSVLTGRQVKARSVEIDLEKVPIDEVYYWAGVIANVRLITDNQGRLSMIGAESKAWDRIADALHARLYRTKISLVPKPPIDGTGNGG